MIRISSGFSSRTFCTGGDTGGVVLHSIGVGAQIEVFSFEREFSLISSSAV
jgi:hypothetical protein